MRILISLSTYIYWFQNRFSDGVNGLKRFEKNCLFWFKILLTSYMLYSNVVIKLFSELLCWVLNDWICDWHGEKATIQGHTCIILHGEQFDCGVLLEQITFLLKSFYNMWKKILRTKFYRKFARRLRPKTKFFT